MAVWVLVLLLTYSHGGVFADTSCSEFFDFNESSLSKTGNFDVNSGRANSFVQVTVFVSEECQENLCDINLKTDTSTEERLRSMKPLKFALNFYGASKNARVSGIVLRNSTNCYVLCRQKQVLDVGVKSLELTYYLYEREETVEAVCNPVDAFQPSSRPVEVCGMRNESSALIPLTIGGEDIRRGYWPWLVAIFHRNSTSSEFKCGATLINRRTILTAAHCLFDILDRPVDPANIIVEFGRHNLSYVHEYGSLRHHAFSIVIHREYQPKRASRESDIGLIIINRDLEYSQYIRPACIWEGDEEIDALVNQTGVVVGWGTDETRQLTVVPKRVFAKVTSHDQCVQSDLVFDHIVTKRNFCAGSLDGTGPCTGDSGGALMLRISGRWVVRGIVSASVSDIILKCNLYKYVVYTDVSKYKGWLISQIPRSSVPVTNIYSTVLGLTLDENISQENSSSMAENIGDIECGTIAPQFRLTNLIYKGSVVNRGTWPWLAVLYRILPNEPPNYLCGGTIISNKIVLTLARCVRKINIQDFEVVVGRYNLDDVSEGQVLKLEQILISPGNVALNSLDPNLAVLKVEGTIRFNDLVRPACLWRAAPDHEDVVSRTGHVVGYGKTEESAISKVPLKVDANIVPKEFCVVVEPAYLDALVDHTFCAGKLDESGPCNGDSGFGLLLNETNKWTLRGVVFTKLGRCDSKSYEVYLDIAPFRSWIDDAIKT